MVHSLKGKRSLAFFLTVWLSVGLISVQCFAGTFADTEGHWAQNTIQALADDGIISGRGDGMFEPNATITRAEYFTLINKAFGFEKEDVANFNDVGAGEWFDGQIRKAVAAGYLSGYEDNTVRPNNNIRRSEAAVVLSRILGLSDSPGASDKFRDAGSIPDWARAAINGAVSAGLINGDENGSFNPNNNLTRAEAATMIQNARGYNGQNEEMEEKIEEPQVEEEEEKPEEESNVLTVTGSSYGPETGTETINKDVVVVNSGTTLRNLIIEGNLAIAATVGNGDVTLDNVRVKGETNINGGGANTISAKNCTFARVNIDRPAGAVRLLLSGNSSVSSTYIHSSVKLEEQNLTGNGFSNVNLEGMTANGRVELAGNFASVLVNSANIRVTVVSGSVGKLDVANRAAGAEIVIAKGATIVEAIVEAVVKLSGEGKITDAVINVSNVKADGGLNISYNTNSGYEASAPSTSGGGGGTGGGSGDDDSSGSSRPSDVDAIKALDGRLSASAGNVNDKGVGVNIDFKAGTNEVTINLTGRADDTIDKFFGSGIIKETSDLFSGPTCWVTAVNQETDLNAILGTVSFQETLSYLQSNFVRREFTLTFSYEGYTGYTKTYYVTINIA